MTKKPELKPEKEIALERIARLSDMAFSIIEGHGISSKEEFARRYIKIAERIKKHYRIKGRRSVFCKHCFTPLVPGKTCKVTIASSKHFIIYTCLRCGKETKIHY
ncbi:MAG: hypothetical protein QXS81_04210 [Candidatus Micrarchaeaceae archaeon]